MNQSRFIGLILSISLISLSWLITTSCMHDTVDLDALDTVCFEGQIYPLIQTSCGTSGCHDSITKAEGFAASGYASIFALVTPGDPRDSKLYNVITDINSDNFMPPGNPLSKYNRNLIQVWIAQGAGNTTCPDDTVGTAPINWNDTICFKQDILPVFRSSCAIVNCHDEITHTEGYQLTDYASIMGSEGITPLSPGSSKIYEVITTTSIDDRMPPNDTLLAVQIKAIRIWITDGALESDCPEKSCDTINTISFNDQVFPIFQNNCTSCHSSPPGNGGILLNNYENVLASSEVMQNETRVLIGAIRHLNGFPPMPSASNQLDECLIRTIEVWIDQGAIDN